MNPLRAVILVAFVAFALPPLVSAQGVSIVVRGGPSWTQDSREGDAGHEAVIDWGRGYVAGGAFGYTRPSGLFAEAEFSLVHSPARGENDIPIGGNHRNQLYLGNVGYEFGRDSQRRVRPSLSFGAGLVRIGQHQEYVDDDNTIVKDGDDWNTFVYHARASVAIQVSPSVAFVMGYRFIRINATVEPQAAGDDMVINIGAQRHHQLEVGLRFGF